MRGRRATLPRSNSGERNNCFRRSSGSRNSATQERQLLLETQRERELASLGDFDINPVAAIVLHHALQYHWKCEDLRNIYFSSCSIR